MNNHTRITQSCPDYELIDSGDGEKLERFGKVTFVRPDPQALWSKTGNTALWAGASARFVQSGASGSWKLSADVPSQWQIVLGGLSFVIKPSAFKHVGVFPEHVPNWKLIQDIIKKNNKKVSVLNLFGYTGGATLAAASAGAEVCHIDASKAAVATASTNAEHSGLKDAPIRWIVDDAISFLKREIKRGKKYDAIIMDPPSFGRGPKGEVWKIASSFIELLSLTKEVLSEKPLFVLINGYAAGYSPIAYANSLEAVFGSKIRENIEFGELVIEENSGRLMPAGIFAKIEF